MSFYTKYQELGLGDIDLISWLQFNSNIEDSGPNGNDWAYHVGNGSALLATSGTAHFTTEAIKLVSAPTSFTAFFDIEKVDAEDDQCVLSTIYDGGNFAFIWGPSGNFYVCAKGVSNELTYVGFFRTTEASKRCIFALSKFESSFLMYLYDPFSDTIDAEFLTIPFDKFFEGNGIILGDKLYGYGSDSNFKVREFALVENGIPGFCVLELCREIHNGSLDDNFKFTWSSVADKSLTCGLEILINANKLITGVRLPYSISPEGFSLLENEITVDTRVFVNGILSTTFTANSGYITYAGMSQDDEVIADFFPAGGGATGLYEVFTDGLSFPVPVGTAVILVDLPGVPRISSGFRQVSGASLSADMSIVFPSTEDLVEI